MPGFYYDEDVKTILDYGKVKYGRLVPEGARVHTADNQLIAMRFGAERSHGDSPQAL